MHKRYVYDRTIIGIKGGIGFLWLNTVKPYAKKHGYKAVSKPFCDPNLQGTLCVEKRLSNHVSSQIELGCNYIHTSFTGEIGQNKTRQFIGLPCHGGHIAWLLYVYPSGRFGDNKWNAHIGLTLLSAKSSKDIVVDNNIEKKDRFHTVGLGPVGGIGFEFTSGFQMEIRYARLITEFKSSYGPLHGFSLNIGYPLFR